MREWKSSLAGVGRAMAGKTTRCVTQTHAHQANTHTQHWVSRDQRVTAAHAAGAFPPSGGASPSCSTFLSILFFRFGTTCHWKNVLPTCSSQLVWCHVTNAPEHRRRHTNTHTELATFVHVRMWQTNSTTSRHLLWFQKPERKNWTHLVVVLASMRNDISWH